MTSLEQNSSSSYPPSPSSFSTLTKNKQSEYVPFQPTVQTPPSHSVQSENEKTQNESAVWMEKVKLLNKKREEEKQKRNENNAKGFFHDRARRYIQNVRESFNDRTYENVNHTYEHVNYFVNVEAYLPLSSYIRVSAGAYYLFNHKLYFNYSINLIKREEVNEQIRSEIIKWAKGDAVEQALENLFKKPIEIKIKDNKAYDALVLTNQRSVANIPLSELEKIGRIDYPNLYRTLFSIMFLSRVDFSRKEIYDRSVIFSLEVKTHLDVPIWDRISPEVATEKKEFEKTLKEYNQELRWIKGYDKKKNRRFHFYSERESWDIAFELRQKLRTLKPKVCVGKGPLYTFYLTKMSC